MYVCIYIYIYIYIMYSRNGPRIATLALVMWPQRFVARVLLHTADADLVITLLGDRLALRICPSPTSRVRSTGARSSAATKIPSITAFLWSPWRLSMLSEILPQKWHSQTQVAICRSLGFRVRAVCLWTCLLESLPAIACSSQAARPA